jgi:glyceraldehyde-3-phosphate dehydrogenase/erythrose-4-phosphate dehydrogenase
LSWQEIKVFAKKTRLPCPGKTLGVEIVIESPRVFTTSWLLAKSGRGSSHRSWRRDKVIISAPAKNEYITIVWA